MVLYILKPDSEQGLLIFIPKLEVNSVIIRHTIPSIEEIFMFAHLGKSTFLFFMIFSFYSSAQAVPLQKGPVDPIPYKENIAKLARHFEKEGFDIKPLLNDRRFELMKNISGKFKGSAEAKIETVEDYKKVLRFEEKKAHIAEFMKTYATELEYAEKTYGIPKTVIAAIIGVESAFGKMAGKYSPFNVYVSMYAENYRTKFALTQLEELLIFASNNNLDVFEMKSSYAGAMSYAQFIPYSLNRWFVGSDLYYMPNNIYSVGKYLAHFNALTGSVEGAVYKYNPSDLYTQAVLDLAKEAEKMMAVEE